MDLIKGEYYTFETYHSFNSKWVIIFDEIIERAGRKSYKYLKGVSNIKGYWRYESTCKETIAWDCVRLSTKSEIEWLNACIEQGKYICDRSFNNRYDLWI